MVSFHLLALVALKIAHLQMPMQSRLMLQLNHLAVSKGIRVICFDRYTIVSRNFAVHTLIAVSVRAWEDQLLCHFKTECRYG